MELLGHMVVLRFSEKPPYFLRNGHNNLHSCQHCMRVPFLPYPCQHVLFVFFVMITILTGVRWYFIMVLICIPLMTSDIDHFFHVLVGYLFISSLEKCVFDSFAHFLIRMFPCLMLNFTNYVYMLNSNLLLIIYKFFSFSKLSFHFVSGFFCFTKAFKFK